MKKITITVSLICILALLGSASDITVGLNISYNQGTSDFFKKQTLFLSESGNNYIENTENRLGIGFNLNVYIPIMHKLSISPGFGLVLGHQHYEYNLVGGDESEAKDHFLYLYSGELSLLYNLLTLKNGWLLDVFVGLNYNLFRADSLMREEDKDFLGMQTGVVVKFYQLEHLGFQALFCYKVPFGSDSLAYLTAQAGILYRF